MVARPHAAGLAAVAGWAAAAADAHTWRSCRSADLRYAFMPGLPDDFGVFRLKISGGRCATAHHVARRWMRAFEANTREAVPPRSVAGFAFTTLPAKEAQEYRERGRRSGTTIRF